MGVDMLFLDHKGHLSHPSVCICSSSELIQGGSYYELSGLMRNNHFKLCDSIVAIRLDEFTKMDEVTIVANLIPSEMFRFRSVDQLMALANTNVELPSLSSAFSLATYNDHTQTTQGFLINIRLDKESTVCVSVFGSVAEILHMRLEAGVVHPKVMVATNINPKFMGGCLPAMTPPVRSNTVVCKSWRLFQLLSSYAKPQLFLWKLQTYGVTSHVPSVRRSSSEEFISSHALHVEMLVGEGEDTALFVAFDSAMTKLTCVRAAEVANPMGQGDQDPAGYEFPQLLQDIVGNTYIFHLKLNEANFSSHHKSFTGGGNNHDDDMHGANCASCKYHLGDSSTGGNPPKAGDEPIETSAACSQHQTLSRRNPLLRMLMTLMDHQQRIHPRKPAMLRLLRRAPWKRVRTLCPPSD
ncbi:LOW QUALITY PROTEIN: hypothetical protein HID58_060415 [Brassica napus]|uniref:Uncharacterized protein n=1 Tax=Brassica napus TaxID=3708 RepID=A0ABQ7ZVR6_BRANA|nr:LOW QUALITY PROTEIN: hypothetical protein HID58_060415 [Brassica napus]